MKKIALISSFCETEEKKNILQKNIEILKSHGLDVMVISPFYLSEEVVNICDYFFLTKDNPVFEWPERAMYYWEILSNETVTYKAATTYPDYGYAGLNQVKQLSNIALSLNYDRFYHIIYDLKIDDNVINGLYSDKTCSIYPSKRKEIVWDVGLHFMIFDRENLKNFVSFITEESYKTFGDFDAFQWLHYHEKIIGYEIEDTPVEDEIFYYEGTDFINSSPCTDFKLYIEKNDEVVQSVKLLFYNINQKIELIIKIGDNSLYHEITNLDIVDLGYQKYEVQPTMIIYKGIEYDITDRIRKIKHNRLDIL